jgi:hypothetical protein
MEEWHLSYRDIGIGQPAPSTLGGHALSQAASTRRNAALAGHTSEGLQVVWLLLQRCENTLYPMLKRQADL